MSSEQYIYQNRAVVFLDVLGFQSKLLEFQNEAIKYKEENDSEFLVSVAVNEFINTFKSVVTILDEKDFTYYLFSDNICITIDFENNRNLLVDILNTINDLFFRFAQKGYFLRGGLDVGIFVDEKDIAVGVPLACAVNLEKDVAMYPRIVLSDKYKSLLDNYEENKSISEVSIIQKNYLIKQHCEVFYINTFFHLVNNEDRIELLELMRKSINQNIKENLNKEKITIKYEWLAREFNQFIDEYISEMIFLESDSVPDEDEITKMKSLKITEYAK